MAYLVTYSEDQKYIAHFNKNHSNKDGRFVSGDGDGDGQVNDRANRSKKTDKVDNIRSTGREMYTKAAKTRKGGRIALGAGLLAMPVGQLMMQSDNDAVFVSGLLTSVGGLTAAGIGIHNIKKGKNLMQVGKALENV